MSGVQIFTESPISSAVKKESATATTSAVPAQPAATISTIPLPASAVASPQPFTSHPVEPPLNPPTPTIASHLPSQSISSYTPLNPTLQPPRSNSLTPSIPGTSSNLEAPYASRSRSASPRSDVPPPPRAGEKLKPASYYSPAATPTYTNQATSYGHGFPYQSGNTPNTATFAQQQGMLSPHQNSLYSPAGQQKGGFTASPMHTPTTATIPAFQGQAQSASFEHPPGYVQNPYAADMTPEQRFASKNNTRSPSLGYNDGQGGVAGGGGGGGGGGAGLNSPNAFSSFASNNNGIPSPGVSTAGGRGGILDSESDDGTVWGMVSGWAKTAGKKMSEVEGEVWKKINGEQ